MVKVLLHIKGSKSTCYKQMMIIISLGIIAVGLLLRPTYVHLKQYKDKLFTVSSVEFLLVCTLYCSPIQGLEVLVKLHVLGWQRATSLDFAHEVKYILVETNVSEHRTEAPNKCTVYMTFYTNHNIVDGTFS